MGPCRSCARGAIGNGQSSTKQTRSQKKAGETKGLLTDSIFGVGKELGQEHCPILGQNRSKNTVPTTLRAGSTRFRHGRIDNKSNLKAESALGHARTSRDMKDRAAELKRTIGGHSTPRISNEY